MTLWFKRSVGDVQRHPRTHDQNIIGISNFSWYGMSQPFQSTDKVELVTTCQSLTWACFLLLLFHAMTMRSLISSRTLWWTWGVCQLARYEKSQMESVSVTSTLDGNRAFFQGDEASRLREDLALLKELPLMFSQSHDVPEQDVHSTSCTNSQEQNSISNIQNLHRKGVSSHHTT